MRITRSACSVVAALSVLLLLPARASGQESTKTTIAVLPFELPDGSSTTAVLFRAFHQALASDKRIEVIDSDRVERERRRQSADVSSSYTDAARVAAIGRLLGARFVVAGDLRDYTIDPPREMPGDGGWVRPVRISAKVRVVDSSTGRIVAARGATGAAQHRVSARDAESASGGDPSAALEDAAEQLVESCIDEIFRAVFPVRILSIDGDRVKLDRGKDAGYAVGSSLACFETRAETGGGNPVQSDSGNETPTGHLTVVELLPSASVALVAVSDGQPKPGDTCRTDAMWSGEDPESATSRPVEVPKKRAHPVMLAPNF